MFSKLLVRISIAALALIACTSAFAQSRLNTTTPAPIAPTAQAMSEASIDIAGYVSPCVVSIEAPENKAKDKRYQYWLEFYGEDPGKAEHFSMLGSGVILTDDGYIVTNNHVIEDADEDSILVKLTDGTCYFAQIVGQDPTTDLAVLRVYGTSFPAAVIANSDEVKVGEFVYAVGNPLGLETTVTSGIISALARDRPIRGESQEENVIHHFLQTDAAINPGNSGGGLFDVKGRLIGINSAIMTKGGGSIGLGLATPSTLVKAVVEDLMLDGQVHRGLLGIGSTDVDEEIGIKLHLPMNKGVRVDDVDKGSAADGAGLKRDDVITAIDGVAVPTSSMLQTVLATKKPNQAIKMSVIRDGAKSELSATLQKGEDRVQLKKPQYRASLGINGQPLSAADQSRLGLANAQGVLVAKSYKYSAAAKAGIYDDDVIVGVGTSPIAVPDDLTKALEAAKPGDKLALKVLRKKETLTKEVILQSTKKA